MLPVHRVMLRSDDNLTLAEIGTYVALIYPKDKMNQLIAILLADSSSPLSPRSLDSRKGELISSEDESDCPSWSPPSSSSSSASSSSSLTSLDDELRGVGCERPPSRLKFFSSLGPHISNILSVPLLRIILDYYIDPRELAYFEKNLMLLSQLRTVTEIEAAKWEMVEENVKEQMDTFYQAEQLNKLIVAEIEKANLIRNAQLLHWRQSCKQMKEAEQQPPTWVEFCKDPSQKTPPKEIPITEVEQVKIILRETERCKQKLRTESYKHFAEIVNFSKQNYLWQEVSKESFLSKVHAWEKENLPVHIKLSLQRIETLCMINPMWMTIQSLRGLRELGTIQSCTSCAHTAKRVNDLFKECRTRPDYRHLTAVEKRKAEITLIRQALEWEGTNLWVAELRLDEMKISKLLAHDEDNFFP